MEICRSRARGRDGLIYCVQFRLRDSILACSLANSAPFTWVDNKANKIPPEIKIGNLGDRRARPAASHALKIPGPTSRQTDRTNEQTHSAEESENRRSLAWRLAGQAPDESEIFALCAARRATI